jgi:hypothetical protein
MEKACICILSFDWLSTASLDSRECKYLLIQPKPRIPRIRFNRTNIVCAQNTSFITLKNSTLNYRVIDYRDYKVVRP